MTTFQEVGTSDKSLSLRGKYDGPLLHREGVVLNLEEDPSPLTAPENSSPTSNKLDNQFYEA